MFRTVSALLAAATTLSGTLAQQMPTERRTYGVLVADTALSTIFLCRDLNNDGRATGKGETSVFLDATNLSGFALASGSVFSMTQAIDGSVFVGEGDSDSVYRCRDLNGDGDVQDNAEVTLWYRSTPETPIATPNGVAVAPDGSVYIASAGVSAQGIPSVIVRTRDTDSDGTAQSFGEYSVFADTTALVGSSTPFDIAALGDSIYFTDLRASNPDVVFRARDVDANGSISADELTIFIQDGNPFGAPCSFSCASDGVSLFVHEATGSVNPQRAFRLTDLDSSGAIDAAAEARELWNETLVPAPSTMANSFSLAVGPGPTLAISSNGTDTQDNVFLARDLDHSGDFLQAGETTALQPGNGSSFPETVRAVQFIAFYCPADWNRDGSLNSQDFFDFLGDFFINNADYNRDGNYNSQDFFDYLAAFFTGC